MISAYIDPGSGYTIATGAGLMIGILFSCFSFFVLFFKRILRFFKKHKRISITLLIIIVISSILLAGIIMNKTATTYDKRIIILGLDGLSPAIIDKLASEGKLPNFTRLKEKGSYRQLSTTNPSQSPIAWSGFATGKNPGKHGLFDFIKRNLKNYMPEISQTNIQGSKVKPIRTVKSFWHYTSEKKVPTVIIACPITFPPDKIYGRMLSGMGVPDILGTQGTFTYYTSETIENEKDIGGKVFEITRKPIMRLELIGPKKTSKQNVVIPFVVELKKDNIYINVQNNHFELKEKQWSDWVSVEFKLGLFKKMRGIFKFYLIEKSPEFKLYISPINFDPRDPFFQISFPASYSKELVEKIGLFYTQGMPMDTWALNEKRLTRKPFLDIVNTVREEKLAMLNYEMERMEKGLLFCYFEDSDIVQHMFWRYRDTKHPLYEKDSPQEYKDMIEVWYQKMDTLVGKVMSKLNDDDILIVLSDHGFDTFRRTVHVNTWLRENGYLKLKDKNAKSGEELFENVDWSKTKAYALGFGGIYVNQIGRESQGIVQPGKETEDLKKEIIDKIKMWRDEKYNSLVVNRLYTKEEIFWGPYAKDAPDLFLGFNIGYRASWQTAIGGAPGELIEDNLKEWSGSHLFDPKLIPGVLFTNFQVNKENPSIYDIGPTILRISGYSDEEIKELDFDGEPFIAQ